MRHDHHDHDLGLRHDLLTLERLTLERRRLLGFAAFGGAGLLAGCGGSGDSGSTASAATTTTTTTTTGTGTTGTGTTGTGTSSSACTVIPRETAGPYPSDGSNTANGVLSNSLISTGIVRADMRSSFGLLSGTATGVPVTLTLSVVNTNASCAALAGYAVYLWHADRNGLYSLYDLPQQNYLRAVQVTDAQGRVTFTTIFPGCYAGRYPHMHFEIFATQAQAVSGSNAVLTSQLALPRDVATAVYAGNADYPNSTARLASITTSSDNVFGDNSAAEITAMTPVLTGSVAAGYSGQVTVGLSR